MKGLVAPSTPKLLRIERMNAKTPPPSEPLLASTPSPRMNKSAVRGTTEIEIIPPFT
jgi:hypothetical protein